MSSANIFNRNESEEHEDIEVAVVIGNDDISVQMPEVFPADNVDAGKKP